MTDTILPHELPHALERGPAPMRVLSLDCFDTLLWRDCYAPSDLFTGLVHVTTGQRAVAETNARKAALHLHRSNEVTIEAIYEHAMPNATDRVRAAAVAAELEAEARTCFAFAPTVELMRCAKAQGAKVIIVSDTYLSAAQLRDLIAAAAGDEVAGLIDRIFVSSEAGLSKSQGLLAKVIKKMKCKPGEILHIGDNKVADYDGARALGVPALHLLQFDEQLEQQFRFERNCQQIITNASPAQTRDGAGGSARGQMPQRAFLAQHAPQISDPANRLGFNVLGPVFHAYDAWLREEAAQIAARCKGQVHWLFMMRDGHLPHIVHQAAGAAPSTACVEISRFVAIGASLTSREAYEKQVALEADLNPPTLARQMLLNDKEVAAVVGKPLSEAQKIAASYRLHDELRLPKRRRTTRARAAQRAERLVAHVRAAVDPQPGDVLMLVDLGYNGSVQDRVDTILSEAFNVEVAGRYMLMRETTASGLDKKGLFDARHYDLELLEAICGNVAVIEQLATCAMGSVVDFTQDGSPIRKQSSIKGAQSTVRDRVQDGVRQFAQIATTPPIIRREGVNPHSWREAGIAALKRLLFLPHSQELDVLKRFEHDANMGSNRMVGLFDPQSAHEGMRRRGLFYMQGSSRMFLPAEIEAEDMNTRLSLMAQKRFALGFSFADSMAHDIAIPVIYLGARDSSRTLIEAKRTHDGYCVARLPITPETRGIALNFGLVFNWLELVGATLSPISALEGQYHNDTPPQSVPVTLDGITDHASGLLECTDPGATALVIPPELSEITEPHMVEVVMRPLRQCPQSDLSPYRFDAQVPASPARNFAISQPEAAKDAAA